MGHQLTPDGVALVPLMIAALGGFGPSQARPQQAPIDGAALLVQLASVAAWAALDHQLTPDGVTLVALRIAALGGFGPSQARPQQAPFVGAALAVAMASVAAWAALDPQQTPDGAALVMGKHWLAPCWAALMTSVPLGY